VKGAVTGTFHLPEEHSNQESWGCHRWVVMQSTCDPVWGSRMYQSHHTAQSAMPAMLWRPARDCAGPSSGPSVVGDGLGERKMFGLLL